jgi:isopenicillin N synthase-like dioxygenase
VLTQIDLAGPEAGPRLVEALVAESAVLMVGHGIDPVLRERMVALTRSFFDLDPAEKERVRWDGRGWWSGWQPVYRGDAELTGSRTPDLLERFEVQELDRFERWPDRPVGLSAVWTAYYDACHALSNRIVGLLATELDLPADELAAWTTRQFANLCANHYPAQLQPPEPGQVRTGAHTDRGGLTLLWADQAPGGLEVRPPGNREWAPVWIPPDAILLQVGDLLARWVNGRIRANVHRVVNPPVDLAASASRLALVYFHYPAMDTLVRPAPSCVSAARPALPPLQTEEHFFHRQESYKVAAEDIVA